MRCLLLLLLLLLRILLLQQPPVAPLPLPVKSLALVLGPLQVPVWRGRRVRGMGTAQLQRQHQERQQQEWGGEEELSQLLVLAASQVLLFVASPRAMS